ncbi:MAG: DUF4038 domain-containing protein [Cyclobacteriaceae bacterium]|nr:DUF4038 domain-containing protein [Cyclobacteriaceae bacterium]
MKHSFLGIILLCMATSGLKAQPIHQWEVKTLSFTAGNNYSNPYAIIPVDGSEDLLTITFSGLDGDAEGKDITLTGFWDGDNVWSVNFAPPFTGNWKYKTNSRDKKLHGKSGNIKAIAWTQEGMESNPTRNGPVMVRQNGITAGHFFEYENGQPFLWIGDTWWNWTKRSIHIETFQKLVDDRAEKGFTIGQLFVPGNGWGQESSILDSTFSKLDDEHMGHVENMIQYANSKGITVWVHGWWSRPELNKEIGEEKMKRWWRYLVHRLGAYNVVWVLAGEYNMHDNAGFSIDFWKELGQLVDREDPYQHIISLHNTPPFWSGGADAPQWSTGEVLHNETWLDYNQSQVGHGKYANEMIPVVIAKEYKREPAKPIVVTEPWYEFVEGNPTGMDVRLAAWGSILSGAAGHTYGGGHVWLAHVPESHAGSGPWPLEKEFDRTTYDYEGAVSMAHLVELFKEMKWWNMEPHPELVLDYPQPFCLANPGEEYVLYLRYGGFIKLRMDEKAVGNSYSFFWYNPATGHRYDTKYIKGERILNFRCPESYPGVKNYRDWVLYIKKI